MKVLGRNRAKGRLLAAAGLVGAGIGAAALVTSLVGSSVGAFTAAVNTGNAQQNGTLALRIQGNTAMCTSNSSNGFNATCSTGLVTSNAIPGHASSQTWTAQSLGSITPSNDSTFQALLTPGECISTIGGQTSTPGAACYATWVTVQELTVNSSGKWVDSGCVYGSASPATTCPAPSQAFTVAGLGSSGLHTLSASHMASHGIQLVFTTELEPKAPSGLEGATASGAFTVTVSA